MTTQANLFTREDTILGVCEGLAQELGVPAMLLRVAFAVGLFWNPLAMVAAYLTLGVALALFRWGFPMRRAGTAVSVAARPQGDNDDTVSSAAVAA